MVDAKNISISPTIRSALGNFSAAKMVPSRVVYKGKPQEQDDEFKHSGSSPLPPEERVEAAIKKFNAANELKIVAETNYFAELDNDYKLLQEYEAYKNIDLNNLIFVPVSQDTLSSTNKGKPVEIKFKVQDDGSKQHEITFGDGSKIDYVLFSEDGKMEINGEEFKMPIGTILEIKSVKGRVFSKLIQSPNMKRNVINIPEIVNNAEQILNNQEESI